MFAIPPMSERQPLPGAALPLLNLTLVVLLSLPLGFRLRALCFLALAPSVLALYPFYTTGSIPVDYWIGSAAFIYLLSGLDHLVLSDAERDSWRVEGTGEGEKRRWKGMGWSWEKLKWSAAIWLSPRGTGWSWEVKNVPPKPPLGYPVRKFALKHILRFLTFYVLVDILETYTSTTPQSHVPPTPLSAVSLPRQIFLCWLTWIQAYFSLNMLYSLIATVLLLLGVYRPRDFPPAFGRLRDSWSVRQFWGSTWHQNMRRCLSTCGRSTAQALGLRKGTNASSYTQLYVAFFLSAVAHEAGAFFAARHSMGELQFFLSQAVAITFEDMVIAVAKKLGIRDGGWLGRAVGYLWVFCWMSYSLREWSSGGVLGGMLSDRSLRFSVVGKVLDLSGVRL